MKKTLHSINDRVSESELHEFGRVFSPDNMQLLKKYIPNLDEYVLKLQNLKILLGTRLNILDYDDTLHSRHHQLQSSLLQENRGEKGNQVIEQQIGQENMLDMYYSPEAIVSRIAKILKDQDENNRATILTAGRKKWQEAKIKASGILSKSSAPVVVASGSDKIQSLFDTVVDLGYIPEYISIFEDRPKHFEAAGEAISKLLGGAEIIVNHVLLSQDEVITRQIDEIRQKVYRVKSV